jgi:hypothetical protein
VASRIVERRSTARRKDAEESEKKRAEVAARRQP